MDNDVRVVAPGPRTPVIVTGAASGMGRATCFALAEWGRPFSAWDVDGEGAARTAKECAEAFGVAVDVQAVDLADPVAVEAGIASAVEAMGAVAGLAHCAGVVRPTMIDGLDSGEWDLILNVNLRAFGLLVRGLLPQLRAHGAGASVVGVASTTAFEGTAMTPAYCASKAGMIGLARSMAHGLAPHGIRVNVMCPGTADTAMVWGAVDAAGIPREDARAALAGQVPLGRMARAEEMARPIRFLLSDDAAYVTGAVLVVDGGMSSCTTPLPAAG